MGFVVMPAMILARTGNNATVLGVVQSALGIGGVVGGLVMSIWGGPKRRIHGLLLGFIGVFVAGAGYHWHGADAAGVGAWRFLLGVLPALYQRVEPVHLAGQGLARRSGPRLFCRAG